MVAFFFSGLNIGVIGRLARAGYTVNFSSAKLADQDASSKPIHN